MVSDKQLFDSIRNPAKQYPAHPYNVVLLAVRIVSPTIQSRYENIFVFIDCEKIN